MKLSKRQRKFLETAATETGCIAWEYNYPLTGHEFDAVREFVQPDESSDRVGVVWRITDSGRAVLAALDGGK
jgi:hypothetical protein